MAPHLIQLETHADSLGCYVDPAVVAEVPMGLSPIEYVARVEASQVEDESSPLAHQLEAFMSNDGQRLLLLLGEAGCGKSMFTWLQAQSRVESVLGSLRTPTASAVDALGFQLPWAPLVLDLLRFKAVGIASESHAGLQNCLSQYLTKDCGLPPPVVDMLRRGRPFRDRPVLRLLVLCDGFDELQGAADMVSSVTDFVSTICGGHHWSNCSMKVVVTCRDGRLTRSDEDTVFPGRLRRVILPFSTPRVRESARRQAVYSSLQASLKGISALFVGTYE
jgi:hypothetical protein